MKINTIKKRIVSAAVAALTAVSMFAGTIPVSALGYGSEWGDHTQLGAPAAPAATVPAPAPAPDPGSDAVPSVSTPVQAEAQGTYSDVPASFWAYNAVERCSAAHWFSGYPDGTFRPGAEILRSEAMKVFVQILGLPLSDVTSPSYYDVSPTDWYAPYVEAGKSLFPDRTALDGQAKFQPGMPITREDTAYALVKTLGYDSEVSFVDESVLNMFSDQRSISTNLRPYIAWAVQDGLISGYPDGTIGAQEPLARAEFATMLYRANMTHGFNNYVGGGLTEKVMSSLTIDPSVMKEINVGESFEITATINYTDGTSEDYTNHLNPYTDSVEGIVTINKNKVTGVSAGTILINYNDDKAKDQTLVVIVKGASGEKETPEPTSEPVPTVNPSISGMITGTVDKEAVAPIIQKRYTVLSLDMSGSMYGKKIDSLKTAAKDFCNTVLSAGGDDYIAIVAYATVGSELCGFTNDLSVLSSAIDGLRAGGDTNIYQGLDMAKSLLDSVTDSDVLAKSVILMTDGYPCAGPQKSSGRYTAAEWAYYEYANSIYEEAQNIMSKNYDVYTIGFFSSESDEKLFADTFMNDIQNKGYYKVRNVAELLDVFSDIGRIIVAPGVNVELRDGDTILDAASTTGGACTFTFTVNEGSYTLVITAPGYKTVEQAVEIKTGETTAVDTVVLKYEG